MKLKEVQKKKSDQSQACRDFLSRLQRYLHPTSIQGIIIGLFDVNVLQRTKLPPHLLSHTVLLRHRPGVDITSNLWNIEDGRRPTDMLTEWMFDSQLYITSIVV